MVKQAWGDLVRCKAALTSALFGFLPHAGPHIGDDQVRAIDGVSFDIAKGEVLAVARVAGVMAAKGALTCRRNPAFGTKTATFTDQNSEIQARWG